MHTRRALPGQWQPGPRASCQGVSLEALSGAIGVMQRGSSFLALLTRELTGVSARGVAWE